MGSTHTNQCLGDANGEFGNLWIHRSTALWICRSDPSPSDLQIHEFCGFALGRGKTEAYKTKLPADFRFIPKYNICIPWRYEYPCLQGYSNQTHPKSGYISLTTGIGM